MLGHKALSRSSALRLDIHTSHLPLSLFVVTPRSTRRLARRQSQTRPSSSSPFWLSSPCVPWQPTLPMRTRDSLGTPLEPPPALASKDLCITDSAQRGGRVETVPSGQGDRITPS
ncbi:hypothetical protein BDM02DRAFT_3264191 [Thelephora ganbajun]|uniref:Uncharacterized protein n=1 Tax=Thelephora ganbajun TaxID=370292 RepID=A0ACB6Z0X9_THEGA|nr:hypothetical protein BDM02DRAFT_3264191 [Thelephora ganbajun]